MRITKKKGIKAHRVKPPPQIRAIDALIGHEEKNGKQNKEEKIRRDDKNYKETMKIALKQ